MGPKVGARFLRDNARGPNVCGVYGPPTRNVTQG